MALLKVVTSALCIAAVTLPVLATRIGASQETAAAKGIEDQFAITLPDGWSVYDQTQALSGKASALGIVYFSAEPVTKPGEATASADLLVKVSSGEILSFFVQREKADKGMACAKPLSKTATYNIGTMINQDPVVGAVRRMFGAIGPPRPTEIEVGGCRGAKFVVDAHKDDAVKHWTIDVRAVSDGKILYLFSLRNKADYFTRNLEAYERAVASVRFKASS
jgi:hypothetical protein